MLPTSAATQHPIGRQPSSTVDELRGSCTCLCCTLFLVYLPLWRMTVGDTFGLVALELVSPLWAKIAVETLLSWLSPSTWMSLLV